MSPIETFPSLPAGIFTISKDTNVPGISTFVIGKDG